MTIGTVTRDTGRRRWFAVGRSSLPDAASAGATAAGFSTYGEIARTHGSSGFHNQTLVVLAVT